jgi:Phage integrase family
MRQFQTQKVIKKVIKQTTTSFPKTDVRHWEKKVAFQTPASRTYSVQIQHANRRSWINLGTANRAQAAVEARKLYEELRANGWDATLRKRKPQDEVEKKVNATIGLYVDAAKRKSAVYTKTLEGYAVALRKIAADICGLADTGEKKSPIHREAWREKVNAIKLRTLTREKIENWRVEFVKRKGIDSLSEKSARISANSFIRRARSLFARDVVSRMRELVELPEPLPFAGVKVEKIRVSRYRATFDMASLIESARNELADDHPEQFKIFLLASMAGLRRNEVDKLPWSAFRWDEGVIRIEATEHFRPKTHDSEGDVMVDPELLEIFRGYHARRRSDFVIESSGEPDAATLYDHYRCDAAIQALIAWLRSHGVKSKTPLHTLRKEYGSQINARYGLTAAQEMLRHSDISITSAHYVENKQRSVLGFGHLLKGDRTIVPMREARQ